MMFPSIAASTLTNTLPLALGGVLLLGAGIQTYRLDTTQTELELTNKLYEEAKLSHQVAMGQLTSAVANQNLSIEEFMNVYKEIDTNALNALPRLAESQAKSIADLQLSMHAGISRLQSEDCEELVSDYRDLLLEEVIDESNNN